MDFETALLSKEPNTILTQLLGQFILNLKPQTRNLSTDQISSTVASVLSEYFKTSERTIFWSTELNANVDPFESLEGGFFTTDWDFKLKILRQLVELQLVHSPEIKATIDRAWGVVHNKHKKKDTISAPPDPSDPKSQERLQLIPLGQDNTRRRYWIADDSPRIYVSTNPWKITATFQSISSTKEQYLIVIGDLKANAPAELKKGQKRTKMEQSHINLIESLEGRLESIDAELARVAKVRKKIDQRRALYAQAELRETRTRRRTQKPDYVYTNDLDSEDDADEYRYQEEEVNEEEFDDEDFMNGGYGSRKRRHASSLGTRRSARASTMHNGKRDVSPADSWKNWRGERRSTRLGAPLENRFDTEPVPKRARTEESTTSFHSMEASGSGTNGCSTGLKLKSSGAAALKPTEVAVEAFAGKKKSKFWVYAVEPIPGAARPEPWAEQSPTNGMHTSGIKHQDTARLNGENLTKIWDTQSPGINGRNSEDMDYEQSMEGSLSPMDAT